MSDLREIAEQQIAEEWWVISCTGDGARTWIVPGESLHYELHKAYCACGVDSWRECQTNGVIDQVTAIDDEKNWTTEYPEYGRYQYTDDGEDYSLTVTRLDPKSLPALIAEREKSLSPQLCRHQTTIGMCEICHKESVHTPQEPELRCGRCGQPLDRGSSNETVWHIEPHVCVVDYEPATPQEPSVSPPVRMSAREWILRNDASDPLMLNRHTADDETCRMVMKILGRGKGQELVPVLERVLEAYAQSPASKSESALQRAKEGQ